MKVGDYVQRKFTNRTSIWPFGSDVVRVSREATSTLWVEGSIAAWNKNCFMLYRLQAGDLVQRARAYRCSPWTYSDCLVRIVSVGALGHVRLDLDRQEKAWAGEHFVKVAPPLTEMNGEERRSWRCFHCDEVFDDANSASSHFGVDSGDMAACQIVHESDKALIDELRRLQTKVTDLLHENERLDHFEGLYDSQCSDLIAEFGTANMAMVSDQVQGSLDSREVRINELISIANSRGARVKWDLDKGAYIDTGVDRATLLRRRRHRNGSSALCACL